MLTFFGRFYAPLLRYARDMRGRRERSRAQRVLEGLPDHLLKDIGWPDLQCERGSRIDRGVVWDAEDMLARTGCPPLLVNDSAISSRAGPYARHGVC